MQSSVSPAAAPLNTCRQVLAPQPHLSIHAGKCYPRSRTSQYMQASVSPAAAPLNTCRQVLSPHPHLSIHAGKCCPSYDPYKCVILRVLIALQKAKVIDRKVHADLAHSLHAPNILVLRHHMSCMCQLIFVVLAHYYTAIPEFLCHLAQTMHSQLK